MNTEYYKGKEGIVKTSKGEMAALTYYIVCFFKSKL